MDTNSVICTEQQRALTKVTKPNNKKKSNKPIKVVYISNPMKVKTSVSEFRALVQELTGQYAESPPNPSKFQEFGSDDSTTGNSENNSSSTIEDCCDDDKNDDIHTAVVVPPLVDSDDHVKLADGLSYEEGFDVEDVLNPQMVEDIWDLLPTSNVFYESFVQLDHHY